MNLGVANFTKVIGLLLKVQNSPFVLGNCLAAGYLESKWN